MRFTLYCCELRTSGGRAVGLGLLRALAAKPPGHDITAHVPEDADYRAIGGGAIRLVYGGGGGGARTLLAHRQLRRRLAAEPPDALYMMGNVALVDPPCPQAVHIHHPWATYPESPAWRRCTLRERAYRSIRNRFIERGFRYCQAVSAQTPVMIGRLHRQFGIPYDRLALIPNAVSPGLASEVDSPAARLILKAPHATRAVCIARYMPHKNLEVLLHVADRLLDLGRADVGVFITISRSHGGGAGRILHGLLRNGRDRVLHNIGEVPVQDVPSCYRVADALVLPTLLESFSGTYIDAMQARVPIITSDLDFAHTVCGDAALYVDPLDPNAIADALLTLQTDPDGWSRRLTIGQERASRLFVDWDEIAERVVDLLTCIAKGRPVGHLLDHPWVHESLEVGPTAPAMRE